jgi:hypothetical protein
MAFQAGSRVDPTLLDYSGAAQGIIGAANIQAAALQDLGNRVGDAVGKFKEKKQKKALVSGIAGALKNNADIAKSFGIDTISAEEDEIQAAAKSVVDTFGLEGGTALYGQFLTSSMETPDRTAPKMTDNFLDAVKSGSLSDRYKYKGGKIIDRTSNKEITLADTDNEIFNFEGAEEFFRLAENPVGLNFKKTIGK